MQLKNIKLVIFDIDYTLLILNYHCEKEFFHQIIPTSGDKVINRMSEILIEYERNHKKYSIDNLLNFINKYSETPISREFILKWLHFGSQLDKQDVSEVKITLEELKSSYQLVAFSNWFRSTSIEKLRKVGLLPYFDKVYGGDDMLKPYPESFLIACQNYQPEQCVMIGDNLEIDIKGAINAGLNAIYVTNGKETDYSGYKVKTLKQLKHYL